LNLFPSSEWQGISSAAPVEDEQTEMQSLIFGREQEQHALKQRVLQKKPFLVHGPTGVGKTLLLRGLLDQIPTVLYCEISTSPQVVFRSVARSLLERGDPRIERSCRNRDEIEARSAVSLKGIVMDALREGNYSIVLDHLHRPSQSFAAVVREITAWCSTPVIAVAQSSHMEDTGFLQPLFSDRQERYELKNFEPVTAGQFARAMVEQADLAASNIKEFVGKVLELSQGNPGAILAMLQMAKNPKYRIDERIKISPLYIDFRMNGPPESARHGSTAIVPRQKPVSLP
jgi:Cdc6-like AAA superfamily ATPase